ncbi:Biogenesis of lysosome-related organelles complex 1 subunit 2 [Geodia barretti]|uniref:Biogenesis of lysosome-related organelles complex 1 subunit 2 n=1 Tax=Geodia barretti TaxID=519541 RepID=A0AA35R2D6_GEOBA|nr:Biogenesis of lysosome-related organelles complex 1 subunit 2 [Geodia barretti]
MSSEESVKEEEKEKEETVEAEGSAGEDVASERNAQCYEMFEKVAEYLNGELAATSEEYALLQRLNQITLNKYQDMTALASRLNEVSQRLNDKFVSLQPYCDQIDQVEASVSALEQTAYRLDAYCKRLEGKFRDLEKS